MSIVENDPSSRTQILPSGRLQHPASCCMCGTGSHEQGFVDIGVFYDYEGSMYFCFTCATQIGSTVGMLTREEVEISLHAINIVAEENVQLKEELENAKPILSAFEQFMLTANPSNSASDSVDPSNVPADAEVQLSPIEGSAAGEPVTEEPVKGSGRPNSRGSKPRNITLEFGS